jgi:hypothetical protein
MMLSIRVIDSVLLQPGWERGVFGVGAKESLRSGVAEAEDCIVSVSGVACGSGGYKDRSVLVYAA